MCDVYIYYFVSEFKLNQDQLLMTPKSHEDMRASALQIHQTSL